MSVNFEQKILEAKELFKPFYKGDFELFSSPTSHFRTRVELSFFHDENGVIFYAMFSGRKKYIVENLDFVDEKICLLMPKLLKALNDDNTLKNKLFGVEFLASKKELSVTLLYHKDISTLKENLENLARNLNLNLIARSKGKKLVFGKENLRQVLDIKGEVIHYEFDNDCFIQPNTYINEKMIEWVLKQISTEEKNDLLELYCGYGNFTLALASSFKQILATELSKKNIAYALKNCTLNNATNIHFARLSSEELSKALKKEREFFRLKDIDLDSFHFSHILLDPPRAGLEESVIELAQNYHHIIYISCNPTSLKENLTKLTKTHTITNFALFDQFALTPHLESGVILKKVNNANK
ncbi:tRNA (uridine(54)-C5)-methyltransferase TrmA [Campylobacter upsaliensis]|uniref:tRNA (uridine(54)-C5)-methyltransferase TrmA n=1 Tax=Campylobacter upsaliensis TaxID=28080 RepID=UPI0022EA3926|nr:tRNA (uridine(54)-C5)-methyltransferase TrmA [Campylobacter upsaliensis]MEB2788138.1 tRNA (uridine(54)-C5)-methyltransferase TrmA [Campylobacter upsaliensis]MEB2797046.1 tRNA (uridine(54)-C5)-methyltransferase TrmA [Campylobacter upsaliensis]HEC1575804.1 tRNA (uridine(54)-C5)-methyltransferase TrmA [Campylobacter upsaliensis]